MRDLLALTIILALAWAVFSTKTSVFFITLATISVLTSVALSRYLGLTSRKRQAFIINPAIVFYWLWLAKEMFLSAVRVTKAVWQITPQITPGFKRIKMLPETDMGMATYANSITLTPGTVAANITPHKRKPHELEVHALQRKDLETLEGSDMEAYVKKVLG